MVAPNSLSKGPPDVLVLNLDSQLERPQLKPGWVDRSRAGQIKGSDRHSFTFF